MKLAFLSAPIYHLTMKNAVKIRKELNFRTFFSFIAQFCNLSSVKAQFVGVFEAKDIGLPYYSFALFKTGDAIENSKCLCSLLKGMQGCYRNTVLFNAAIALHVAGRGNTLMNGEICTSALKENIAIAAYSLESGLAYKALMRIQRSLCFYHAQSLYLLLSSIKGRVLKRL